MKHTTYIIIAIVAIAHLTGCTLCKISGRSVVPIVLNQPNEKMELMEHVKVKKNRIFDWTNSFDVSEVLSRKITADRPDMIVNTTMSIKYTFGDFWLNLITLDLAYARQVVVEADFMKDKGSQDRQASSMPQSPIPSARGEKTVKGFSVGERVMYIYQGQTNKAKIVRLGHRNCTLEYEPTGQTFTYPYSKLIKIKE